MIYRVGNLPPIYALAALLGCITLLADSARGQGAVPAAWAQNGFCRPGEALLATGEPGRFLLMLDSACTAAVRANRLEELRQLMAAGGPAYMPADEFARPLIFYAAQHGDAALVGWLLDPQGGRSGDYRLLTIAGRNPLELAAEAGRPPEIVALLLGADCPPELRAAAARRAWLAGQDPRALQLDPGFQPPENNPREWARHLAALGQTELGKDSPADHGAFFLAVVARGKVPNSAGLQLPPPDNAEWQALGLRALRRAISEHEGSAEKLWPLAEAQGWLREPATTHSLAGLAAETALPRNLDFILTQLPADPATANLPNLVRQAAELQSIECLGVLRRRFPGEPLLAGLPAREIFANVFRDNVEAPSLAWLPYLKRHPQAATTWREQQSALHARRLQYISLLRDELGLAPTKFPPEDLGPVLRSIAWLQDGASYRQLAESASPAQRAWVDDDGIALSQWESWCGLSLSDAVFQKQD